ncbi:Acetyltransferase (GNAT) domain-containing protein [Clostridium acidisoli DSM 12555]|uniref:Acetyltransferase (GNAT) domain-containing protein n=1 Tax=Clostridium acidisoli DSM 12555 TaxID=1121291 RepID=A0A1W1X3H9_9CLOT|nr:GNAT family N-acetyltransferase [Clostridium acidisoli]SMC18524.1 Acetyltransferase (GNAT) domain-containing protein [Clostridium acidisoli DSM 12555]
MKLNIKQMNYDEAKQISKWIYKEPYSIYSMDGSDNCIGELLNETYFSASDEENHLIGYYCFGESAQVPVGNQFGAYECKDITDIGLGINPNLCGQGLGLKFFISGLDYARNNLSAKRFRLTVATFNKRAIKVYQKAGFKKLNSFERITETGKTDFWVMILC